MQPDLSDRKLACNEKEIDARFGLFFSNESA